MKPFIYEMQNINEYIFIVITLMLFFYYYCVVLNTTWWVLYCFMLI